MVDQNYCDITFLIDRSGSMRSKVSDVEGGFNQMIEEQKALPGRCTVTIHQFDQFYFESEGGSLVLQTLCSGTPIAEVPKLQVEPRGDTPLLDAMGLAIQKTGERLAAMAEDERPGKVLFIVFTDGQENSSREFKLQDVREMVARQEKDYSWIFVFVGAGISDFSDAHNLGFKSHHTFNYMEDVRGHLSKGMSTGITNVRTCGAYVEDQILNPANVSSAPPGG